MVWGLFPVDHLSGEDKYYIFKRGIYRVGRKGCDVIITKDKGVSRVHAEIIVNAMTPLNSPLNEPSDLSTTRVQIRDCSKYGTFISKNGGHRKKVHEQPNKETSIEDGDLLSFGIGSATYRFCHVPLVFFVCSDKVDQSFEDNISSIGACITHILGQECTHVLVDHLMPLKDDLVDAVVANKPCVCATWLEFVAERNIGTEIPSCNSYIPTLSVEGASVKVSDPKTRENCLKGFIFLLESAHLYKLGDRLKSLLEVSGAKVVSFEEYSSNSQGPDYGDGNRLVYVIPGGPARKLDGNNKLSSLARVNEMDVICAALSGQLDLSLLMTPCVLVSSSCSTDETIVADSDTEVETATSAHANDTICIGSDIKHENTEMPLDDASDRLDKIKYDRMPTSLDNVSARLNDPKHKRMETPLEDTPSKSDIQATSFRESIPEMTVKKNKADDSESGNSDIIYSQCLVVRDVNVPNTISTALNSGVPNFKRFRKVQTQSGNSFSNLVPFAKYPYKESDNGSEEMVKSVNEEKKRKQMEAIAEDLFNNEKGRKRGTAGSLRGILIP
ncbi:hypothetical protein L6164_030893 [Bauhinia variegata]|uniref:Uncharacterized protein n=1 Tax=Bauhinia variegata TaxID=167791 RepID=A0ACB9LF20_BAUVA|nr:hypothetical protein L6164_030893 [Bauhinia variegata]